jgi:hypothetical protein
MRVLAGNRFVAQVINVIGNPGLRLKSLGLIYTARSSPPPPDFPLFFSFQTKSPRSSRNRSSEELELVEDSRPSTIPDAGTGRKENSLRYFNLQATSDYLATVS